MMPVPVLLYHSIDDRASARYQPWAVSPRLFEDHMQLLADGGYTPVPMSRVVDTSSATADDLPAKPVVLTFDDGLRDFRTQALPILERHGFASTLYVITRYLGGKAGWLARQGEADRDVLSLAELRDVVARGVECGAHSHTHPKLDELPVRKARDEIVRSRESLEAAVEQPVRTFAYPYGYHGPRVRQLVIDAGYDGAAAVRHARSSTEDDPFALARLIVYGGTTLPALDRMLHGDGVPQAPYPAPWRTTAWRVARRTGRSVAAATRRGSPT